MSLQIVQNQQLKPIGDKVPIDTTLSSSSENAISNKAVNDEITRINSDLTGSTSSITMNPSGVINIMTNSTNSLDKVGRIVTLNFFTPTGNTNAIPNNVWHTIGTLPIGFRPSLPEIRVRACTRSGDGNICIRLYSTGEVQLLTPGVDLGAQVGLAFDISYPV